MKTMTNFDVSNDACNFNKINHHTYSWLIRSYL